MLHHVRDILDIIFGMQRLSHKLSKTFYGAIFCLLESIPALVDIKPKKQSGQGPKSSEHISRQKIRSLQSYNVTTKDAHTRTFVLAPYSRTLRTEYEKYGVQRVSYPKSTDWSTGYGNFCQNGVRRVRGTKSTVLVKYGFWYGVRLIFGVRSTESTGYE